MRMARVVLVSLVCLACFAAQGARAANDELRTPVRARCLACGHLDGFGGYAAGGDCDTPNGHCSL